MVKKYIDQEAYQDIRDNIEKNINLYVHWDVYNIRRFWELNELREIEVDIKRNIRSKIW